ncbi:MAG: endonuclease [Bacteroidales bacterium]|nr:endonuclease [Bacteroidales bacterium]
MTAACVFLQALLGTVVLFWNVENCFDSFDDPLKNDDDFTPSAVRHWTWSRFEHKRDGIAQAILAAGALTGEPPALVGFAEVENRLVVSQIVRRTFLEELGYGFVHRESPDARGIDVALLYRKDCFRVMEVDSLRVPGVVTRDILYVLLREPAPAESDRDPELHVFVVHLPSKLGGARRSQGRRDAALGTLRGAVDSLLDRDAEARIVVMGDFNDTENSVPGLRQAPFLTGARAVLPTAPGTLKYHGRWEQIDHFFISPALQPPFTETAMLIFAPSFLLEQDRGYMGIKPRRTYVGPRYNGGVSDHLPIVLFIPR